MLAQVWNYLVFSLVLKDSLSFLSFLAWVGNHATKKIHQHIDNVVLARKHATGTKIEKQRARYCRYVQAWTKALATQFLQQVMIVIGGWVANTDVYANGYGLITMHCVIATACAAKIDWADPRDVKYEKVFTMVGHLLVVLLISLRFLDTWDVCCPEHQVPAFTAYGLQCPLVRVLHEERISVDWETEI